MQSCNSFPIKGLVIITTVKHSRSLSTTFSLSTLSQLHHNHSQTCTLPDFGSNLLGLEEVVEPDFILISTECGGHFRLGTPVALGWDGQAVTHRNLGSYSHCDSAFQIHHHHNHYHHYHQQHHHNHHYHNQHPWILGCYSHCDSAFQPSPACFDKWVDKDGYLQLIAGQMDDRWIMDSNVWQPMAGQTDACLH